MTLFNSKLLHIRKEKIANKASQYNFLRVELAKRLLERFDEINKTFEIVLDLGASLGEISNELKNSSKVKKIIQVDTSKSLLAKNPFPDKILLENDYLPFQQNTFDAVISILYLHNINNLKETLENIYHILKQDSPLIISIPTIGTLENLSASLMRSEIKLTKSYTPRIHPFIPIQILGDIVENVGFKSVVATSETIEIMYKNFYNIIKDLRGSANNNLLKSRKIALPKSFFKVLEEDFKQYLDKETNHFPIIANIATLIAWKE